MAEADLKEKGLGLSCQVSSRGNLWHTVAGKKDVFRHAHRGYETQFLMGDGDTGMFGSRGPLKWRIWPS